MGKRIVLILSLTVFAVMSVSAVGLGTLKGVMKPDMIEVFGNEIYVVEGSTISIYSLKGLSLIRKFGNPGEGPGELKQAFTYANRVIPAHDRIFVDSVDKVLYFSKEGKLISEKRKPFAIGQALPIGKNFVVKRQKFDSDKKIVFITLGIFDSNMEEIKELFRQKFIQQGFAMDLIQDFLRFQVFDDKLFIEESPNGFVVEVFDSNGEKLYQIKKEYNEIEVTTADREAAETEIREDPMIKPQINAIGGWAAAKKIFTFNYPDKFPAIQDIAVSNNKIYIRTSLIQDNKNEYFIMDLKGKILEKLYMPRLKKPDFKARLLGVKLNTIYNDRLYFIQENNSEEWELHMIEMNMFRTGKPTLTDSM